MDELENKIKQGKRLLFAELRALFKRLDAEALFSAYLSSTEGYYFGSKEDEMLLISQPNAATLLRVYSPWNSLIPEVQLAMIKKKNAKELLSAYQETYVLYEEAQIAMLRSKNASALLEVFMQKFKLDLSAEQELVDKMMGFPKAKAKALLAQYRQKYELSPKWREVALKRGLL